ncbi:transcriptional activator domain-containing protein [Lentzea waywayandensis]|uniref:Transcriptional activator domain-containing protein n=1 Tax=Lentzea waywayandensis TaxID=84724 RepID=A0A1I6ETA5_9PSEU|nr:BTAD domain-containing putative transcriptional regulator [Lentzea waywayandensis]SFR20984.1 transcriptional activator domain-containing protein [Lentzea waywayandensis]
MWGDAPPRQAKAALYSYLSRLRTALDGIPIVRRSGGYVLETDPASIDLHRFRALVTLGRPDEAMLLVRERPLDERLASQLMRALIGAGQRSAALVHYAQLQGRLADELGLNPGPALRDLHASLIQRPQWSPRQLPAAPMDFTGVTAELAALDLAGPIVTITGPAGTGKTRLALHWAHEHTSDYPDGQLFVDLNGSDPADVVREFITALGTSRTASHRNRTRRQRFTAHCWPTAAC